MLRLSTRRRLVLLLVSKLLLLIASSQKAASLVSSKPIAFAFRGATTTKTAGIIMDEELKRIRQMQRERWLANNNSNNSSGDNGGTSAASAFASASASAASSSSAAPAAGSFSAADTSRSTSCAGNNNDKPVGSRKRERKVVDLTFDSDSNDDDSRIANDKEKAAGKNDDDSDASSEIEVISPPRKKSAQRKQANVKHQPGSMIEKATPSGPFPNFAVATYNIWFGQPHPDRRMEAISSILCSLEPRPLIVGLQEVTPYLSSLLYPLLQSVGYEIVSQPSSSPMARSDGEYFVAIAVLTGNVLGSGGASCNSGDTVSAQLVNSGFEPYQDTIMNRGLMWVHVRLISSSSESKEVIFTTTHLESFMRNYPSPGSTYDGVRQRKNQIRQAAQYCRSYIDQRARCGTRIDAAIITGDLNWDDERPRSKGNDENLLSVIDSGSNNSWSDAWLQCRPGEVGATYDSKKNDMLKGNLRRRFDRCLVWSGGSIGNNSRGSSNTSPSITPIQCDLIGTSTIPGVTYRKEKQKWSRGGLVATGEYDELPVSPSDHFGLFVKLGCSSSR